MERILNAPMLPYGLLKTLCITPQRSQEIAPLKRYLSPSFHPRLDHANPRNVSPRSLDTQTLNITREPVAARLNTTMIGIDALIVIHRHIRQTRRCERVEKELDLTMQGCMVVLESQDIISPLLDDATSDLLLASHGVNRHRRPVQLQQPKQVGDGGDLIGLVIDPESSSGQAFELTQHDSIGTGPGANHVDGALVGSPVKEPAPDLIRGAPQGFAVNGDVFAVGGFAQTVRPVHKTPGEFFRVKP